MKADIVGERMGNPRYEPRSYTDEPESFGKARTVQWKPIVSGTEDERRAAQIQHAWAVQIRRTAAGRFGSLAKYANAAGLSYDRLTKVMRGSEVMRLEDLATAERILGAVLIDEHIGQMSASGLRADSSDRIEARR